VLICADFPDSHRPRVVAYFCLVVSSSALTITAYTKNTTPTKPTDLYLPTTTNATTTSSGPTFEQQQAVDTQMFGEQPQTALKF